MKKLVINYRDFFIGFVGGGLVCAILYCVIFARVLFFHPQLFVDFTFLSLRIMDFML